MQVLDKETNELVEVEVDRTVKNALEKSMKVSDRLLLAIQECAPGQREVYVTVDTLVGKTGLQPVQVYNALHTLANQKRIEMLKERSNRGGVPQIVGFKLDKVGDPAVALQSGAEKAKSQRSLVKRAEPKVASTLVHLSEYMGKKLAKEQARTLLVNAGIDAGSVNEFLDQHMPSNPLAEEAINIYQELVEAKQALVGQSIDKEIQRRQSEIAPQNE